MAQFRQTAQKDLIITCVKGEGPLLKFWALPVNALEILKTYENHFSKAASELEKTSGFLTSDQTPVSFKCAVLSKIKRQWCRARVLTLLNFTTIRVQLIDYGNEETVSVADVRKLDESFFRYPGQAVECIFADIAPCFKGEWSENAIRFCEEHLLFQTVTCIPISEYYSIPVVRIAKKGESEPFVQRLINNQLACIKQEVPKHQGPTPPMQQGFNQLPTFLGYKMNSLDLNTVHLVKVSFIENVHKFYVQLAVAEMELKKLMDEIKSYTTTENLSLVHAPNVNTPCLAQFSSKPMYYRAVITSMMQGRCSVLFVDYGCTEVKEFQDLRAIPNRFLALQAQAICCCLSPSVQIETEEFFRLAKSGFLNCHILERFGDAYVVQLTQRGQDVIMPQHTPPLMRSQPMVYQRQKLNTNVSHDVIVSYTNDVTDFYCQLAYFKDKVDEISSVLNSGYDHEKMLLSDCVPNMPVCVKFSEDHVWYRAQIVKVNDECDIEVFFVDFGNYDNANIRDVRRLKPELLNLPMQAYKCSLFEVDSPTDDSLRDDMYDMFEELTTGQVLKAEVKAITDGQCYAITLRDENSSTTINEKIQLKFLSIGTIPVSDKEKLYITSFTSLDSFFAQFEKICTDRLERMQDDINEFYASARSSPFKPKEGSFVCAKYNVDEQFYRARVDKLSGVNCEVFFIDYGNRETCSINDLRSMNVKFTREPRFGIDCKLESYPPAAPVDKLKSLMLENTIEAKMIEEQNGKWVIALTEDCKENVAILEILRQHETLVPRSIHGAGLRGYQENPPQREYSPTPNGFRNTPNSDFMKPQRKEEYGSKNDYISPSVKEDINEIGDYNRSFCVISIPPKAYRNVYVSHVVNPSEFYVQIEEESFKLQSLMKDIEDTYANINDNALMLKTMDVGSPCCAVFEADGAWYRGQVKKVDPRASTVYFIDYGNSDTVPNSKIKQLERKFFDLPPQAIRCKSYNVTTKGGIWSKDAIDDFINMTLDKSFVAQFVEPDSDDVYAVNLVSIGKLEADVLNKEFVTLGHGQLQDAKKIIVLNSHAASSNLSFLPPPVKIGSVEAVTVTYGYNPGEIFCQLKKYESEFNKMMNDLQAYYSQASAAEATIDRPHQGMICVAQFHLDSAFYRGEIKKVEKNSLTVSYIDYGNCETVDRKKISCITQDFTLLPIQGVKCRLQGIKPPGRSWPVNQNISKYFEGDAECNFISKEGDSYLIDLVCNRKNVAELLVRDGIALSDSSNSSQKQETVLTRSQVVQPLAKTETTFIPGQLISVAVSFIQSPYKFWCQLTDESEVLNQLMADIETQYIDPSALSISTSDLQVGVYCMAKYSADEAWYRAQIKSISAGDYEVFFIDYGNSEVTSIDQLASIHPDFLKFPAQCFECRLPGASPTCDDKKTEEFQAIVDEVEEMTGKVENVTNNICIISLLYEKDGDELNVSNVLFGDFVEITTPAPEDMPKFLPPDVPLGAQEGYVTVVNTPHDFYIQLATCEDALAELSEELSANCEASSATENVVQSPCIGYACAAKYSDDNNWYRAEIIGLQETTADVLFVDYGNVSTVPTDTLKTLSKKLLDTPPYAIRCKLNGITSTAENWTQSANDTFQEMVTDLLLGITFISKDIPATVNISKDDKDVAQSLIESELANVETSPEVEEAYADDHLTTVEDQLHSLPSDLSYPKRKLMSLKMQVKISYVDSYDKFFVMPLELSTELDTVMKTLEILYGTPADSADGNPQAEQSVPETIEDPCTSMPCVAKYSEDEAWYRAVITEICKENVCVSFVDYGNSEMTTLNNMRPLTPELIKIPPIAIECKLYGIKAVEGREQEITAKLEEYFVDEIELDMEIMNVKEAYEIKLFHNGDLAEILCNEGLATEVITTTSEIIDELLAECVDDTAADSLKTVEVAEDSRHTISLRTLSAMDEVLVSVKYCEIKDKLIVLHAVQNDLNDELEELVANLQTTYNEAQSKPTQINCLDFCVAKYSEDENWYRAQVASLEGDEITVKFIDYGNTEVVNVDSICELLPEFISKPQFSLTFCLTGYRVDEGKDDDLQGKLDEYVYSESILLKLCKLTHKFPNICITDFISGDDSLVEMFLTEKYISQCYIEYSEIGDKFEATIENVIKDVFYVLPATLKKERDNLEDDLQTFCCDISASSDEINPAQLYAVKISERWSRVSISEIDDSSASAFVKLVDYGFQVNVKLSELCVLPVDLCHRPLFLQPCKVINIEDTPNAIKNKEMENIKGMSFVCEVQKVEPLCYPLNIKVFEKCLEEEEQVTQETVDDSEKCLEEEEQVTKDTVDDSKKSLEEEEQVTKEIVCDFNAGLNSPNSEEEFHSLPSSHPSKTLEPEIETTSEETIVSDEVKPEIEVASEGTIVSDEVKHEIETETPDFHLEDECQYPEDETSQFMEEQVDEKGVPPENADNLKDTITQEIESQSYAVEDPSDSVTSNYDNSLCFTTDLGLSDVETHKVDIESGSLALPDVLENSAVQPSNDESILNEMSTINAIEEGEINTQLENSFPESNEVESAISNLSESDANLKFDESAFATESSVLSDDGKEVNETQDSEVEDNDCRSGDFFTSGQNEMNNFSAVSNPNGLKESNETIISTRLAAEENDWDERPECDIKQDVQSNSTTEIEVEDNILASSTDPSEIKVESNIPTASNEPSKLEVESNIPTVSNDSSEVNVENSMPTESTHPSQIDLEIENNYVASDFTPESDITIENSIAAEKGDETNLSKLDDSSNESMICEKDPPHHILSGKVDVFIRDVAISNGSILLAVTPYHLHLELESKVDKEFQATYTEKEPGFSHSSNLCAVQCDSSWFRGKVLASNETGLSVLLIDYGTCKAVSLSDVKDLEPNHKEIPPYVVWCTLTNLYCPPEKCSDTKEYLDSLLNSVQSTGGIVSVEVIEEEEPYKVVLFNNEDNLSYRLLSENLVTQQLAKAYIHKGEHKAKLSHLSNEGGFSLYINLSSHLKEIKTLKSSMESAYPVNDVTPPEVQLDSYYAVRHEGSWVRGRATSPKGEMLLHLIDSGEMVSVNTDIYLLFPVHCLYPSYAIPCEVPVDIARKEDCFEALNDILNADEFLVSVEKSSNSEILIAKIIDQNLIDRIKDLEKSSSEQTDAPEI